MDKVFKRSKKGAVQLTSLLDLLFVMVFVSLLQQKEVSTPVPTPKVTKKVQSKPIPKQIQTTLNINSLFHFYTTSGVKVEGKFGMEGLYNQKTGRLNLVPVGWIDKPNMDIGMVPLAGKVSEDKMSFTGRVDFEGCRTFKLNRINVSSGTPIAGTWKGTYTCAQGSTGLTLTIK